MRTGISADPAASAVLFCIGSMICSFDKIIYFHCGPHKGGRDTDQLDPEPQKAAAVKRPDLSCCKTSSDLCIFLGAAEKVIVQKGKFGPGDRDLHFSAGRRTMKHQILIFLIALLIAVL